MRNAIVLAAGKGTRMKSDRSKVMHTIIDRSMLAYIIDALRAVSVERIVVIVGYQAESIKEAFPDVEFALQQPQLGDRVRLPEKMREAKEIMKIIEMIRMLEIIETTCSPAEFLR